MRGFIIVNRPDNIVNKIVEDYTDQAYAGFIIVSLPDNIVNKIVEDYSDQTLERYYYCQSSG